MVLLIIGIVLIGLGVLFFFLRKRTLDKLLELRTMQHSPVGEIIDTQKSVSGELGTGSFRLMVETNGRVVCDQPLEAELSGEPCAHYDYTVEERYEETYWERDSEGRDVQRTRESSRTVASGSRTARFYVDGDGGRILVRPDGARFDLQQSVNSFEPAAMGTALSFGSFSFVIPDPVGHRVLGYNYRESILPIGVPLYVIGEASDAGGELAITKPSEKNKPFTVSIKSKEEVTQSEQSKAMWLMIGAIVSALGGVAMVVAALMKMKK